MRGIGYGGGYEVENSPPLSWDDWRQSCIRLLKDHDSLWDWDKDLCWEFPREAYYERGVSPGQAVAGILYQLEAA